jgi:hypothetical protein
MGSAAAIPATHNNSVLSPNRFGTPLKPKCNGTVYGELYVDPSEIGEKYNVGCGDC